MATIEADVTSHLQAVLHERLSKANRDKILQEQRKQASSILLDSEQNLLTSTRTAKGKAKFVNFKTQDDMILATS